MRITAGTFCSAPAAQRPVGWFASRRTSALRTPGTLWMASVTCRAQLAQVMPVMANSVTDGGAVFALRCAFKLIFCSVPIVGHLDTVYPNDERCRTRSASASRQLQAGFGEAEIDEAGASVRGMAGQVVLDPGRGGFVFAEEQQITATAGAEQLDRAEKVTNAVEDLLHFGRVGAGVQAR